MLTDQVDHPPLQHGLDIALAVKRLVPVMSPQPADGVVGDLDPVERSVLRLPVVADPGGVQDEVAHGPELYHLA
jgi:hypothetical protein